MTPDQHRDSAEAFAVEALDLHREPALGGPDAAQTAVLLSIAHGLLANAPVELEPVEIVFQPWTRAGVVQ